MSFPLGKLDPVHDPRTLQLEQYATPTAVPPTVTPPTGIPWGMLGNDRHGDCVWAGAAHEVMHWTRDGGHPATFTSGGVLSDYAAVTGFDPRTGDNDNGTNVLNALKYRTKTGTIDRAHHRHLLGAYVSIGVRSLDHIRQAVWELEAVGVGIQFPDSAQTQFANHQPWTPVDGATIEGGHYVPVVGYDPDWLYVVTWGRIQKMSWSFWGQYGDEAWGLLSTDMLRDGRSPLGFDLPRLRTDLGALRG